MPIKCRSCLEETDNINQFLSINISLKLNANRVLQIKDCFREILNYEFTTENRLPDRVCLKCVTFMKKMHIFIDRCRKSEEILRKSIELSQINTRGNGKDNNCVNSNNATKPQKRSLENNETNRDYQQMSSEKLSEKSNSRNEKIQNQKLQEKEYPPKKKSNKVVSNPLKKNYSEHPEFSSIELVRGRNNQNTSAVYDIESIQFPILSGSINNTINNITPSGPEINTDNVSKDLISTSSGEISIIETFDNEGFDSFNPVSTHWPDFDNDLDEDENDVESKNQINDSSSSTFDLRNITSRLNCTVHGQTFWNDLLSGTLDTSQFFEKNTSNFCTCFVDFHGNDASDIDCCFCTNKFRTLQAFVVSLKDINCLIF